MTSREGVFQTEEELMADLVKKYKILKYFKYGHLPENLQEVSKRFSQLAYEMAVQDGGAETAAGLRKLLEAKDCAVRAALE